MSITHASATPYVFVDTLAPFKSSDTLKFPISDRRGDIYTYPNHNPFNLSDPKNIVDSIEYDPVTKHYNIVEKIGTHYYRTSTYLTFEEVMRLTSKKSEDDYFRKRADMLSLLNRKNPQPKFYVGESLFNRLFGNGKVDIKPQGNVDITAGYQGQDVQNPTLPESARKTGGFDFKMDANVNVLGDIGSKLKLPISYNTQANFDFMNKLKLDYTGGPDEIIKKIEAGNTSFSTKSTLMSGAQSLFGLKTQLQFGKLSVTAVIATEQSQSQSVGLQGGAATTQFRFSADDYDENRNFLLAQYFRSNFNRAMSKLPIVTSEVQVLRVEVWVTNRNLASSSQIQAREVVGLMDLGESAPFNPGIHSQTGLSYPFNNANDEYQRIISNPNSRSSTSLYQVLNSLGLQQVQDFEQVYARKLDSTQYKFYPQIGFISLNQQLQPNDVLAVAYQYSYNGKIYQVGEFSEDVTPDTTSGNYAGLQQVLYLKLLKATSQRTNLPIWNLMMKNVYSLKTGTGSILSNIQPTGFQLNVLYNQPSKGEKNYLPAGDKTGLPLISVLNLDRLNSHQDPIPDGVFDYLEGYTIISSSGRVIFPLLEPFGKDLDSLAFKNSPSLAPQYVFSQLYDTIKSVAQTYANVDRFILSGTAKGQSSSEISLGALNVPPGSVIVTAGGQALKENVDYTVDYSLGTVHITNQAIVNSGVPVNVQFENNASFNTQQKSFIGVRLDYLLKNTSTTSFNIGGTLERLNERPFFTKTNYGEDPIRNTMYGLDVNYRTQLPQVTRLLSKIYPTKESSSITAYGESAFLKPGHPPQIGKGNNGTIYIDDFEGSTSNIDLRFPLTSWALASTPQGNGLFPEATLTDSLDYGFNRAKLAWYNIEPTLQDPSNGNNPVSGYQNLSDPRVAPINVQQLFPQQTPVFGQAQLVTFDVSYWPTDRGPYNFDTRSGSINPLTGKLLNPQKRWGGIMRAIDQTDFETNNIQYLEFWMMSPFNSYLQNTGSNGGQLYIDLGSVSEDIVKDGKKMYENGLPTPNIAAATDTSVWGKVPLNPIQVTNAFSNTPSDRPYQDVGFDGLNDDSERVQFSRYLNKLAAITGSGSAAYLSANNDPSSDNFTNYRDPIYDASKTDIIGRYKNYSSPQGNSPIATTGQSYVNAATMYPDAEDLNHDNTLNQLESYFEYKVNISPNMGGANGSSRYVTDSVVTTVNGVSENWYQFRIPINSYVNNVGNIPDFQSIQFIRMYLTGFTDSIVCRFAEMQLVRDSWRNFSYVLDTTGIYSLLPATSSTTFNVTAVNIEQNSSRSPIPYVIPPGIQRQQSLSTNNNTVLLNEQSMSLQICNLAQGDARGVFKTVNLDLRKYGHMDLFVHAESTGTNGSFNSNDLYAVVRLGSDFISNYYEIRIPLTKTNWYDSAINDIWPDSNNLNLSLSRLVALKENRNKAVASNVYYKESDPSGRSYAILGNPNLGQVQAFFLGVQNANQPNPICTEVWFDELRLSEINDKGGWAAVGRVDLKLADLGRVYVSGSHKSANFGTIDQDINARSLDNITQINAAANLELGKLLPKKLKMTVPFYASISSNTSKPEYDPFDLDILLNDKLKNAPASQRDSIRKQAVDASVIKTVNLTNVRIANPTGKVLKLWSIENFDFTYSFTRSDHHNPIALEDELINYKGGLGYNFNRSSKFKEPLKKIFKPRSKWLQLIKDINFSPMPSVLSFRGDANKQFGAYRSRNIGGPEEALPETYNKFFNYSRKYILRWDLTKSVNIDFSAINLSVVDDPDSGRATSAGRRQVFNNFLKGGRNVSYNQTANLTYTFPTSKFPLIDWTSLRFGYSATYGWTAASLLATTLGNTLQNTQQKSATAELDFTRLYSKWKWLRALEPPKTTQLAKNGQQKGNIKDNNSNDGRKGKTDSVNAKNKTLKDPNQLPELTIYEKVIGRLLTSVKRVNINYSENSSSTVYGYMDSTQALGMDLKTGEPGLGYIFGRQPGNNFVNNLAQKGLISHDTTLNFQNQQNFNQLIRVTAQLKPIKDLNIDVNLEKTFGKTYSELFKDTTGSGNFAHLNAYLGGTFNVSFISLKTLFEKSKPDEVSGAFAKFESYRSIISNRLGTVNPYSSAGHGGYYVGYGQFSQDVLIPAFLAAYTGKDPHSIALINENNSNIRTNPFSGYLPKPNWRIAYNGLAKLPGLDHIFSSFNITNAYTSNLNMGGFNSSLLYQDPLGIRYPGFLDTISGNFVPYFTIPNLTITESFSPLINLDMQFVNQLQARVGYNKSRTLSLSLIDFQMVESRSSEFTFGGGFKKKGVKLPFKIKMPGKSEASKKLDNTLNFRLDFSIRNDITSNTIIDQTIATPTGGQKVVTISPSLDYVLSNAINVKLYFDQRRTTPAISSSPPINTTRAGLMIRINLAAVAASGPPPKN